MIFIQFYKPLTPCHNVFFLPQQWSDELMSYSYNLLALNGCTHSFLEKAYTKMTVMTDREGRIPVKK